jgi:transposase InsO family protein
VSLRNGAAIAILPVTEPGYGVDRSTGGIDLAHRAIAADLARPDHAVGVAGLLVWRADIIFLPMWRGFLHLLAIMDRFTRKVPPRRISNTQETNSCVHTLNKAIQCSGLAVHALRMGRPAEAGWGAPEIHRWKWPPPRQHLH